MQIRRFKDADSVELAGVIARTLRTTNSRDYSPEYIEEIVNAMSPDGLIERNAWTHLYVACEGEAIIGCGAIGPYYGREDESCFFTIFVLPECQGRGIGRKIVETLERDPFFLRARRIEVPASITAVEFYKRMGYGYKNGVRIIDEEQLCRMEKFR